MRITFFKKTRNWVLVGFGVLIGLAIVYFISGGTEPGLSGSKGSVLFEMPSFVSTAEASDILPFGFPENEAGLCAYTKASSINVLLAKDVLTTVETLDDNHVIGTIEASTAEKWYPHIYISSDGWIIAFIPRELPESLAIPTTLEQGFGTTLGEAIIKLGLELVIAIDPNDVKYYHFKYPDAVGLVMGFENDGMFQVTIPASVTTFSQSWVSDTERNDRRSVEINGDRFYMEVPYYGSLNFEKNIVYNIDSTIDSTASGFGVAMVYR